MWVGRKSTIGVRFLLTETVELVFGQSTFDEGASVNPRGGMALNEDLVSSTGVVLAAEEVVEAHFVERGGRGIGRDVTTDTDPGALCAVNHDGGVPTNPSAVTAFDFFVTGEGRLVLGGNRVEVVRGGNHGHTEVQFLRAAQQAEHNLAPAAMALCVNQVVE